MTETARLTLPLVQAGQAQKHVTVNEALARLDGLVQLVVASRRVTVPPAPVPGLAHIVPEGAGGAWAGQAGALALAENGGWVIVPPRPGWRAWVLDEAAEAVFAGEWVLRGLARSASGAGLRAVVQEFDHDILPGAQNLIAGAIPARLMLIAVSARVIAPLSGSLSSWRLGMPGAEDRFGTGLGCGLGSYGEGMLGAPMTVWNDSTLCVTAEGGSFTGGRLRLAVQGLAVDLPGG